MQYITLENTGAKVIVDDDAYYWLKHFKWVEDGSGYAVHRKHKGSVFMHRIINNTPKQLWTDHINCNRKDNRRSNLRDCTLSENAINRIITKPGKSRFRGVSWSSRDNKWRVMIQANGKRKQIGVFSDEIEAAIAYDMRAMQLHGEFAQLNILNQKP